jgi:hypothetical protein
MSCALFFCTVRIPLLNRPSQVPFERVLGKEMGRFMQQLHEANRVCERSCLWRSDTVQFSVRPVYA